MTYLHYRVWDGEQMHYWDDEGISLTIENDGSWFLWHAFGGGCVVSSDDKDAVLMWGTGLKDKNDRAIYEGDVVKYKSLYYENKIMKAVVKFKDSLGSFVFDMGDYQSTWRMDVSMRELEVIGDVYRNPDLLEAAE